MLKNSQAVCIHCAWQAALAQRRRIFGPGLSSHRGGYVCSSVCAMLSCKWGAYAFTVEGRWWEKLVNTGSMGSRNVPCCQGWRPLWHWLQWHCRLPWGRAGHLRHTAVPVPVRPLRGNGKVGGNWSDLYSISIHSVPVLFSSLLFCSKQLFNSKYMSTPLAEEVWNNFKPSPQNGGS